MNQKGFIPFLLVGLFLAILILIGGLFFVFKQGSTIFNPNLFKPGEGSKACTMDAKLCPDGTSVGREGPNCEFAPCPSQVMPSEVPLDLPVACTEEAKECPDGSYVSRTGPDCEFAPCPTNPSPK